MKILRGAVLATSIILTIAASAEIMHVGSASYTTTFPGYDSAGRNSYPAGTPALSGRAAGRPVPTNDWWSAELAADHAYGIFNYPMALRPEDGGLVILNNMPQQGICAESPVCIGLAGLSCSRTTVSDYSDWTVTITWQSGATVMNATIGLGMPMVYFTRTGSADVSITVATGTVTVDGNVAIVADSYSRAGYAFYAPAGASWQLNGRVLSSDLAGKDYWTAALLPAGADFKAVAAEFKPYAHVHPADTRADWAYDSDSGDVITTYSVTPIVKEGVSDKVLMGMLPHQYHHLDTDGIPFLKTTYGTVRGTLRLWPGNSFDTRLTFHGILPSLPVPGAEYSSAFDPAVLKTLTQNVIDNNGFAEWTDSYNDGQLLNRLVQVAEAARAAGDTEGYAAARNLVKKQLERWFTYNTGDVAFLFYYHEPWNAMLGYPAGHGQDSNLNDHNFHWGYFIRAAAFIAQDDAEWAAQYGPFVDLLCRDVASPDRNDTMFPYLRAFSPYAGHCWANGTASLALGNDQESTSEAMNFNTALILWGDVTGNTALRDLGVYLYATELSAIQEYWFDVNDTNFDRANFKTTIASRVFGNGYDDQNFWGGGIAGSYGIQIYPVTAGSFYLMDKPAFASKFWQAMSSETGILSNEGNPNIWYDSWLRFLAMHDPAKALQLYAAATHLGEKFGDSQAHTYQWLHAMAAYGTPSNTATATHPLAMAFERDGVTTYIARNNTSLPLSVHYNNGFTLDVPAHSMATAADGTPLPPSTKPTPDPIIPGGETPAVGEGVEYTGTQASEGTFTAPWHVMLTTVGTDVKVTAWFEGTYEGFAGPWLFDETNGFREIVMGADADGHYTATLSGLTAGTTLRLRVKIAFVGNLAVTTYIEYVVGTTGILDVVAPAAVSTEIYDMMGRRVPGGITVHGIYIIKEGATTRKIIK